MMVNQRRCGPVPATHTGICSNCGERKKVSPANGRLVRHGYCNGRYNLPVEGSLQPVQAARRRQWPTREQLADLIEAAKQHRAIVRSAGWRQENGFHACGVCSAIDTIEPYWQESVAQ